VAHILGLKDYTNLDSNTTLGELGMDSLMGVEVKQFLERDYEIVMSMQDIRKLSIATLGSIGGQNNSKCNVSIVDKKLSLNQKVFEIPEQSFSYLNEISSGNPVIFLPPLEGSFDLLKPIAKNLSRPAIGLNWTNDCAYLKTIEETALHYLNLINDKLHDCKDNYDLIGYSFGGVVAYEMCSQLERSSKNVNSLILLDSSPIQYKIDTEEAVVKYNLYDEQSQRLEALVSFLMQYVSIDYQKVKALLQNTPINERTLKVSQIFLESQGIQSDSETIEFVAQTFSNKLLMLNSYATNGFKLCNDLLLIRAQEHIINNKDIIKHDYGLSEVCLAFCLILMF
jgi:fatty acid synthase